MSSRTRVKICGITRAEDALAAVEAGADALGFVFYEASSRCVNATTSAQICKKIPPFITKVALFVNAEKGF
ncbi:MAG: N-(5'-phosphoribosyl)anthranilate isomerase, partial [Cycloclasticus sp.]|nr:N-(5'-phosphoribosyl)anthranilate isomerase [Cycloclasticus sp.]